MTELIDKIRAAIDEDERLALAVTWPMWTAVHKPVEHQIRGTENPERNSYYIGATSQPAPVDHMARHDPARVLAMVAAHREILEEHKPSTRRAGWDRDETICGTCSYDSGTDDYAFPCPTMRALAKGYGIEW